MAKTKARFYAQVNTALGKGRERWHVMDRYTGEKVSALSYERTKREAEESAREYLSEEGCEKQLDDEQVIQALYKLAKRVDRALGELNGTKGEILTQIAKVREDIAETQRKIGD